MSQKYAKGSRAWGICGRSGRKMLLKDMVFDGRYPNMRVDPAWWEDKHPQEYMPKVEDPTALYRPSPEVIAAPTAPVLSLVQVGLTVAVTWTAAESGITEIASYTLFRSVDSGAFTQLGVFAVLRDFLGGIIGVQNCTTVPSIPRDDTASGSVFTIVTNEDAPVTYLDTTTALGHAYCYYVIAQPMGNNQSVGQGPPSPQSNTVCLTIALPTATTPVLSGSVVFPQIPLTWTAATVSGATITNYLLFRQTDGGAFSLYQTLGNVLDFTDAPALGHTYGYFVVAVPSFGNNSADSNTVTELLSTDPLFPDVVLLLHLDTDVNDSSLVDNPMTLVPGGIISSSSPKFGAGCFLRSGTTSSSADAVITPIVQSSPLDVLSGSTDFTIEGWINFPAGSLPLTAAFTVDFGGSASGTAAGGLVLQVPLGGPPVTLVNSINDSVTSVPWETLGIGAGALVEGVWYHWAIQRVGGFGQLFFNGLGSAITPQQWQNYAVPVDSAASFGFTRAATGGMNSCLLDEIRVTRGVGRYSGTTYTPPTAPTTP